jgi:hypothetical protein
VSNGALPPVGIEHPVFSAAAAVSSASRAGAAARWSLLAPLPDHLPPLPSSHQLQLQAPAPSALSPSGSPPSLARSRARRPGPARGRPRAYPLRQAPPPPHDNRAQPPGVQGRPDLGLGMDFRATRTSSHSGTRSSWSTRAPQPPATLRGAQLAARAAGAAP